MPSSSPRFSPLAETAKPPVRKRPDTRPLSATLLAIATVAMVLVLLPSIKQKREETFKE